MFKVCIVFVAILIFSAWVVIIEFYRARARKLGEMAADIFNEDRTIDKECNDEQSRIDSKAT